MVNDWASRISWRWGVTVIVALVTALVVAIVIVVLPRNGSSVAANDDPVSVQLGPPDTPAPTASPTTAPSTSTATSTSTSTSTTATTTPLAASGPGVSDVGISVWANAQMDGSVEVMESAIYADYVDSVTLRPVDAAAAGAEFAGLVPRVTHLQVTADGTPVGVLQTLTSAATVTLPVAARHLELRYHLDGSTVRSVPSSIGRASIVLGPLSVPEKSSAPSQIRVSGVTVRNLTCPRLDGEARACAPASGDLGIAPILATREDVVVVQVDLPSPS